MLFVMLTKNKKGLLH